jgi:hypothetical protein
MKDNQKGGDGYSINVNESIGGLPAYSRYSNNYRPVFEGDLLQNGGDCGCDNNRNDDDSIYNLIKQNGGNNESKVSQFEAIKEIARSLTPLSINSLKKIIMKIFINDLNNKKPTKAKQFGGYVTQLQNILAPLGKNNLLVIAGLLLLHHFAVKSKDSNSKNMVGGSDMGMTNVLTKILAPLGVNQLGASVVLILLHQAFTINKKKQNNMQKGGNPLKNLIAPLGTNAFIATGLLILLEKVFTNKMKEIKTLDKNKKKLIGGKITKKREELFNLVAPITFNTFATKTFLKEMIPK